MPPLDAAARIGPLLDSAVAALDHRQNQSFDDAIDTLAALWTNPDARRLVDRSVLDALTSAVTRAWQGGWQPVDLHRLAGRRHGAAVQEILSDAVVHELSRYAPTTVDPRWAAQLAECGAEAWWPPHTSALAARITAGTARAQPVLADAVTGLHLLLTLPPLGVLGPVPGTARPRSGTERRDRPVDERILTRVRALLAKAESTTFEAEAETFTAGAQALMARHSIDHALLASAGQARPDEPGGRRIGIDNPYDAPKAMLLTAVATANRCRSVWARELGFATVVGHEVDVDAVETLFTSLLVQAQSALNREGSRSDRYGRSRTRAFRGTFLTSYALRIGERLRDVTRTATDAAVAEAGAAGRDLLPVLSSRDEAVDKKLSALFPRVTHRRLGSYSDGEGWASGRAAADRAALDAGAAIGPPASGSG